MLTTPLESLRGDAPAIAIHLKSLNVQLAPDPIAFPDEVKVEVRAENASKMVQMQFSIFPRNLQ